MPVYQCSSPVGKVSPSMKSELAQRITDIHVAATGAPAEFVHVIFGELPEGAVHKAGKLCSATTLISGTIRAGRSVEVKQQLLHAIVDAWTQVTGQPVEQVVAGLSEVDPQVTMEYGLLLPAPGEEAEWFTTHEAALRGIHGTGF